MTVDATEWLIWQLVDSLLPTGGFTTSSGLEAALQLNYVKTSAADPELKLLQQFLHNSLHSTAASSLPIISSVYSIHSHPDATHTCCSLSSLQQLEHQGILVPKEVLHWLHLDQFCNASLTNTVARRASSSQGTGLLSLLTKSGLSSPTQSSCMSLLTIYRQLVLASKTFGHLPVSFGITMLTLDIPLSKAFFLFLFIHVRTVLSAAVRLNILGPYKSQELLAKVGKCGLVENIVEEYKNTNILNVLQTSPLTEMCLGYHDRLYSRLFNS